MATIKFILELGIKLQTYLDTNMYICMYVKLLHVVKKFKLKKKLNAKAKACETVN